MSNSVVPSVSRTSLVATPSATWHVGLPPNFPSSLTLSNDAAIESLVMDIPFLSVGLLGFGVITFFFAMRRFNRLAFYTFASVIVAFIAGVLDVGQVLTRGQTSMNNDTDVSSVLPLLIARELALAVSIGIRFLFFWTFVSRAPRGERPSIRASQDQRPNFLRMDSDIHSGSWTRWGLVGALFKYILLLATIAIPVLQLLWRLVAQFSKFGPIYNADGTLQIAVSALFILKLFANTWFSPLTPRWKTLRDYSPIIIALLIDLGLGIGNILCFQFSETSLGRLLQAVELYIMVLYVLISSFYHQRSRMSMVVVPQNPRSIQPTPFEGLQAGERLSSLQITTVNISTPEPVGGEVSPRTFMPDLRPSNKRLSSWLIPETNALPERAGGPRRASTAERLTSWMMNRRASGRQDREQSRLWNKDDLETGTYPVDEKAGYAASLDGSPTEPRETTWKDPVYTSIAPSTRQRLEQITTALDQPSTSRGNGTSPDGTISEFNIENYRVDSTRRTRPPGSPVYGLEGIVRYHDKTSPLARPDSAQSSGMESLLRQQAELDKSVAELQLFSSSSHVSTATSGGKRSVPGGQPESFRSDFSLSNFPEPPPALTFDLPAGADVASRADEESSTLRAPRMPAASADGTRQQSFPSITRWSGESGAVETGVPGRAVFDSSGTQYDVTSFIGDLTTPALKGSRNDTVRHPVEQPISESVAESTSDITAQLQTPPPAFVATPEAPRPSGLPAGPRRIRQQGLPPRSRLNISGPIPRANVEKSTAYERPRPVPVP